MSNTSKPGDGDGALPDGFDREHLSVDALKKMSKGLRLAAIVKATADGRSVVRANAARALAALEHPHNALLVMLRDGEPTVQEASASALAHLGAAAEGQLIGAVVALRAMREPGRSVLLRGLAELATSHEPLLLAALARVPTEAVNEAVEVLDFIGDAGANALVTSLGSPHIPLRLAAVKGLERLVRRGTRIERTLLEPYLNDPLDDVRFGIRTALRDQAEASRREKFRAALPSELSSDIMNDAQLSEVSKDIDQAVLIEAMNDGRTNVRANAARLLGALKSTSDLATQRLVVLLRDSEDDVQQSAVWALKRCTAHPNMSVPGLLRALASASDGELIDALAEAVANHGEASIPFVSASLDQPPPLVKRSVAIIAGKQVEVYTDTLLHVVNDKTRSERARRHAAEILTGIGAIDDKTVASAVDALYRELEPRPSPTPPPRPLTPRAARVREPDPPPAVGFETELLDEAALKRVAKSLDLAYLERKLTDGRPIVRHNAAVALGVMGKAADSSVVGLAVRLKDGDPLVVVAVARALSTLGSFPEHTAPALAYALPTSHRTATPAITEAIRALGAKGIEAIFSEFDANPSRMGIALERLLRQDFGPFVGPLAKRLSADKLKVREQAAELLWNLGADAKGAKAALVAALEQREGSVRVTAIQALAKLGQDKKVLARLEALREEDPRNSTRYAIRCAYEAWGLPFDPDQ